MVNIFTMDDFEIIESVKEICHDDIYDCQMESKIKEVNIPVQVAQLSKQAQCVMDTSNAQWKERYFDLLNNIDISNEIANGRDVVVSNKMIVRSYRVFAELMNEQPITPANINLTIVYACNVCNCEYIQTWQDKQTLVLLLLRMYITNNNSDIDYDSIHFMIESHVPIIVEKVLHASVSRGSKCWRSLFGCVKI